MRTSIGDERLQNGYTGDIIATGTPSGTGAARTPSRWLKPGDVVRIEIDRVGVLENPAASDLNP